MEVSNILIPEIKFDMLSDCSVNTICFPSELNAADVITPKSPQYVLTALPEFVSQSLAVLSDAPESIKLPSGEKMAQVTRPECPVYVWINSPDSISQSLTVLSYEPDETIRVPSGLNET